MAVRKKMVLLMSLFALVSTAGLSYVWYAQHKTLDALYGGLEKEFDAKIEARSAGVTTFVNDYSYWDALVRFMKSGDTRWAQRTFVPGLKEYKANAVWIYRTDGSCAFAANNITPGSLKEMPVPREACNRLFAKSRSCRFFVFTPQGMMEVRGATIHPTNDPDRKTAPQGYLLAGKIWDSEYINEVCAASQGTLVLARRAARRADSGKNSVVFSRPLRGWDGGTVMFARVMMPSALISSVAAAQGRQFYPMVGVVLCILALLYFFIEHWISTPLNLIYGTLDSEDVSKVSGLLGDESEFGYIAGLITRAFEQKAQLLKETAGLRSTMETQKKESDGLSAQVRDFAVELSALRDKYKTDLANRQKDAALFGTGDYEMLKMAYDDLDHRFHEQRTKLHVVNELLQREIIKSHEHYKAEMVAAFQREQALKELNRMTLELGQQKPGASRNGVVPGQIVIPVTLSGEEAPSAVDVSIVSRETKGEPVHEKKQRTRRKVLGTNMPKINYTEARC
jgi:sensor domain CHASE-containing protein